MTLRVLVSEGLQAGKSMRIDESLLRHFEAHHSDPVLRIYSWARPSITLGYSQASDQELDRELCKKRGIDHAVRPTGGGMVFHTLNEVAVSFVSSKRQGEGKAASALLKSTSALISGALSRLGLKTVISNSTSRASRFCSSYAGRSEIESEGRKIVGIAQRVGKRSVLQQASIFVDRAVAAHEAVLRGKPAGPDLGRRSTCVTEQLGRTPCFEEMAGALIGSFGEAYELERAGSLLLEELVVDP